MIIHEKQCMLDYRLLPQMGCMSIQTLGCDSERTPPHPDLLARRPSFLARPNTHAAPVLHTVCSRPATHRPHTCPPSLAGARVLQVMRMGAPVTSLSLGPAQDLLATSHVGKRGVYLWANQVRVCLCGWGGGMVAAASGPL